MSEIPPICSKSVKLYQEAAVKVLYDELSAVIGAEPLLKKIELTGVARYEAINDSNYR